MFDFDELISLGPAEASRRLRREQDWEALERFGESLLGHSCPMGAGQAGSSNPPVDINGTPFSSWVMWLATSPEGEEFPEAYMMRVQDAHGAKSNVCGRIWGKGYVAYRCRTCGMSPCSAICHECFEKGPHRTHNFLMYRSVAGGCCDCGDPGAWKSTGFCTDHKGPNDVFQLPLPDDELRAAFVTAHTLVKYLAKCLSEHYDISKSALVEGFQTRMPEGIKALLELVQRLCKGGEVYRRIVCAAVLEDIGIANPSMRPPGQEDSRNGRTQLVILEALVRAGTHLSTEMSNLFLQLLFDFDFKREFTRVFIRVYEDFMKTILLLQEHKEIPTRMVDISVQLFSNSVLTISMIREERLLSTLFRNVLLLCSAQSSGMDDTTVNCEHAVWTKRTYWPITNDLVNILSHRTVVIEFLMNPKLVLEWLQVSQRFQAMDVHIRQQDVHIEIENRQWTSPFFIELELVMEQMCLLETGLADFVQSAALGETDVDVDRGELHASMREILRIGVEKLGEWMQEVGMSPNASEDSSQFHPISYDVQSQPVSLHIPLHRFVSFFLSQLGRHIGTDILYSVFPSRTYVLSFIEHPLRVQVLLAQIRAGIWRWNGETMLRRAWFYRSSYFYDFGFDLDLFILQTAASLLDPETLLVTLLHRFNLVSVFGFKSPRNPERDGYDEGVNWSAVQEPFVPTIVEDLLVLVGAIVGERARLGYTDKECIEQEVIARLCVRPHAHSQLTDNICRRWHEHDNFEGVLNGVAVYEPPKSDKMEQGKYKLKNEYMGQEQKHLVHILVRSFNHGDYEAAMGLSKSNQRPEDGASSSTSTGDGNGADKREERLIQPAKGLFQRLGLLLESRVLHQVLHRTLQHALDRSDYSSSMQVHVGLLLLQAALEHQASGDASMGQAKFGSDLDVAGEWGCVFRENDILKNVGLAVEGTPKKQSAMGEEEEEDEGEGDAAEAQSIIAMLQSMQKLEEFAEVHSAVGRVIRMYNRQASCESASMEQGDDTAMSMSQGDTAAAGSSSSGGGEANQSAADAKAKARERQEALLASFAAQQKQFADAMLTDDGEESEEEGEEGGAPSETKERCHECVICSVSSKVSSDNPMGLVSLVQRSRLMASSHHKAMQAMGLSAGADSLDDAEEGAENIGSLPDLNHGVNLHFQSCGHHIHLSCFGSYFKSLLQNERHDRNAHREQQRIDLKRGLFLCPMCRQIANVLVPLLPDEAHNHDDGAESACNPCTADDSTCDFAREFAVACRGDVLLASNAADSAGGRIGQEEAPGGWSGGKAGGVVGGSELGYVLDLLGKRLMHFTSQDQSVGASAEHHPVELLRVLVNGIGATIGCMELSTRDPVMTALSLDDQILSAHQRMLNVLYSISRVALQERASWEGHLAAECGDEAHELLRLLLAPPLPPPTSSDDDEPPLLCRDMYSTLVRLIYTLPSEVAAEHRFTLRRACFLAASAQAFMSFHLGSCARAGGSLRERSWKEDAGALAACLRNELSGDALGDLLEWDAKVLSRWQYSACVGGGSGGADAGAGQQTQEGAAAAAGVGGGGASGVGGGGGGGGGDDGSLDSLLGECVRTCTHSFLRKAGIAFHVRFGDPMPDAVRKCTRGEWEGLARAAGISYDEVTCLPEVGEESLKLVKGWAAGLKAAGAEHRAEALRRGLPAPASAGFPLLVQLPELYHDLYMSHRDTKCKFCGEVPHRPALCLMCGELACFASECCRRVNVPGASDTGVVSECFAHSVECGAGTGVFMLLKTSMVLLIRETHWCIWGSPYLDAYGEEDPELKRGRPLHLNKERYHQLQLLYSTLGFDHNSRVANSWLTGAQRY